MKTTKSIIINIQFKWVKILLTIFVIIFMLSCKDKDELILEKTILQGTWIEVEPEDVIQFAGENHTFTFSEDSFYLKLDSWTDVVYPEDTCASCPTYTKGEYFFDSNTINFSGKSGFDSNFVEKGDTSALSAYQATYDYKLKSSKTLVLNPESEYESITLVKQ